MKSPRLSRLQPVLALLCVLCLLVLAGGQRAAWAQTFYQDTFVGTTGTDLASHAPNIGNTYTASSPIPGPLTLDGSGRIAGSTGSGYYIQTAVPSTNPGNYTISFDVVMHSSANGDTAAFIVHDNGSLASYNSVGIANASGVVQYQLKQVSTILGTSITLSPPSFPTTYHCAVTILGTNISATISGGELSGTQTITGTGGVASGSATGYGPLISVGTSTTHYQIANALGFQGTGTTTTPVSSGLLPNLGLSQDMWDTSAAGSGRIDNLLPGGAMDMNVTIPSGGAFTVNCDTSLTNTVYIAAIVDGTYQTPRVAIGGSAASSITVSGLSAGVHRLQFYNTGGGVGSRWIRGSGSATWRVTSFSAPTGTTFGTSSRPANYFMAITDSIGEGTYTDIGTPASTQNTNDWLSWTNQLGLDLGLVNSGLQVQGVSLNKAGVNYETGALNPSVTNGTDDGWDHIHSTLARSFAQAPQFILLCLGTNEAAGDPNIVTTSIYTGGNDAAFSANIGVWIGRVRAKSALTTTPIYACIPFGGYKRQAIINGVADYKAANPGETNVFVFDMAWGSPNLLLSGPTGINEIALWGGLTANLATGTPATIGTTQAADAVHPNAATDLQITTIFNSLLGPASYTNLAPPAATLTAGTVTLSGSGGSLTATGTRAIGGSAPYFYQFQQSTNGGSTWANAGSPVYNQAAAAISPYIQYTATGVAGGTQFRLQTTDSEDSPATVTTSAMTYGTAPPTITSVSVAPSTVTLAGGGTQTFTATVVGTNGGSGTGVTWAATAGSITSGGVFTAPAATGSTQTVTITATSTVDTSKTGTATVTVPAASATVSSVSVSPTTATLSGAGTQTFTAVVTGTFSPSQSVTWAASAGSITSGGVFTAPSATSSIQVITATATSTVDSTKSGTATITIPALVVVTPSLQVSDPIDSAYPFGVSSLQMVEEIYVLDQCKAHTAAINVGLHTQLTTYYAANGATVLATSTQSYDIANAHKLGRPRIAFNWSSFAAASGNLLLTTPIDTTGIAPITVGNVYRREDAIRAGYGARTVIGLVDSANYYGQGGTGAAVVFTSAITTNSDGSTDRIVSAN